MSARDETCERCRKPMPGGEGYAGSMDWWLCEECTAAVSAFVKDGKPERRWTLKEIEAAHETGCADFSQEKDDPRPGYVCPWAELENALLGRKNAVNIIERQMKLQEDHDALVRDEALEEAAQHFEAKFKCKDHTMDEAIRQDLICTRDLKVAAEIRSLKSRPG